jgi:long-chain fatty acid transport protein
MNKVKSITGFASFLAAMGIGGLAFAAGFANTAQSGTATGMAGVATANPDEPNANFYNPASMGFLEGFNLYVGPTIIAPGVNYTSPDGQIEEQTERAVFPPPNLHLAIPFGNGMAFGLGVTLPWGLAVDWPDDWVGREIFLGQSLQTLNINPNFAYRLPGIDLSLAAGVQIMRAAIVQRRAFAPREDADMAVELGGTGTGFGATAGLMFRPTETITLGLNYRIAVNVGFNGRVHFSGVEDTPFEQIMIDQPITTSVTLPHTIGAGFGWRLIEPLFVGLDVNYMTWSTYDRIVIEYEEQSPNADGGPTDIAANWSDAIAVRLGFEYEVIPALKLRTGFAVDLTPVPAETVGPSLPDNDRFILALGMGYTWNQFRGDVGYNRVFVGERVITNGNVDGTYQMGAHVLGINLGYGF